MTASFTVTVQKPGLTRLQEIDWSPTYGMMASYLTAEMGEMFATAGGSRGHPWQELAPRTLIRKVKAGKSTEILQRTGRLRASFRTLRLTQGDLTFGTTLPYAKYHDSQKPRTKVPLRPLIRVIQRDRDTFAGFLQRHVVDVARNEGGGA